LQVVEDEIYVLKRAVTNISKGGGMSKPKLLESNPFGGGRSSKELENYMWDME
jgi:hypothetical protein